MKAHLFVSALIFTLALGHALAHAETKINVDSDGLALKGYDPVSYFQGDHPKKGSSQFSQKESGATYFFVSEANRKEFQKDPKKYEPQFGGWCAYAVATKKAKVVVDPNSFLIQDGKLLLFYNGILADTRKKWSADPAQYIKTATANWPEVEKTEP